MTQVPFSPQAYGRPDYGLPEARLVNYMVEKTPTGPTDYALFPRPGITGGYDVGSGPIRGLFRQPGAFDGTLFIVTGTEVRTSADADLGDIPGTDLVRFASSATQLVAASEGIAYLYEGSTFSPILDGDLPPVQDVAYIGGRFIYVVQNSDQFFWSEVNDASNIDGLSYATAEGSPDTTVGVAILADEVFFFGTNTVEIWQLTGDDNVFQRVPGRRYMRGCAARDTIIELDNALFWVGEDLIVYRSSAVPDRVSTYGIEDRLKKCDDLDGLTAIGITVEGHKFYILNIPGQGSFAWDVSTKTWAQWESYGYTLFRGRVAVMINGIPYIGDSLTSDVWSMTPNIYTDDGGTITWIASAFIPQPGGTTRCENIVLQGARGVGTTTGNGSDPVCEMRFSTTQGRGFNSWKSASLGAIGQYGKKAQWRALGTIYEPGWMVEIRTTDPVLATASGLLLNVRRPNSGR